MMFNRIAIESVNAVSTASYGYLRRHVRVGEISG